MVKFFHSLDFSHVIMCLIECVILGNSIVNLHMFST